MWENAAGRRPLVPVDVLRGRQVFSAPGGPAMVPANAAPVRYSLSTPTPSRDLRDRLIPCIRHSLSASSVQLARRRSTAVRSTNTRRNSGGRITGRRPLATTSRQKALDGPYSSARLATSSSRAAFLISTGPCPALPCRASRQLPLGSLGHRLLAMPPVAGRPIDPLFGLCQKPSALRAPANDRRPQLSRQTRRELPRRAGA